MAAYSAIASHHNSNKETFHSNYCNLNPSVMQTYQPLDKKFIVEPSYYIILHQTENKNLSKTYIRLLDLKKSNAFLLLISRQNTYKLSCEFVPRASWFFSLCQTASKISDKPSAKPNFISIKAVWSWI